jgi:hypothetical protein
MESTHHDSDAEGGWPLLAEDDAELERDYQELARWLVEVYLWEVEQARHSSD